MIPSIAHLSTRIRWARVPPAFCALPRLVRPSHSVSRHIVRKTLHLSRQRRNAANTAFPPNKLAYPARVLIFHAGTGKIVFLGCLKLTTVFLFIFSSLLLAPSYYYAPDPPRWIAPAILAGGTIPMLYVMHTSTPFVCWIHLRLPLFARRSRDALLRYAKNISGDAKLDITTMKHSGRQRVTVVKVAELKPMKSWFTIANYERVTGPYAAAVWPWWITQPQNKFYIGNERGKSREKVIWEMIAKQIKTGSS